MLEAIRERAQGWLAKIILALLVVPFALWGIDSYFRGGGEANVIADVDGFSITAQEFRNQMRNRLRAERQRAGTNVSEASLDTPTLRKQVLEDLVTRQLVLQAAVGSGFRGNDAEVAQFIGSIPAFQENGKFSQARYEAVLRSQDMAPQRFEASMRQDMILRQFELAYTGSSLVSMTSASHLARIGERQIELSEIVFAAAPHQADVSINEADIRDAYQSGKERYTVPARVRLEYVVLSQDAIAEQVSVDESEARKYYDSHPDEFREAERRDASHILIMAPAEDQKARETAKKKAEGLLAELRAHPERFADIARKSSQDPGSAEKGGELGSFPRGVMVQPFEAAVFSMREREIRGPVETEFGYHIIRLNSIVPGTQIGFDVVRGDILQNLRRLQAGNRFAEAAEQFSNLVYEQPDSLRPAADALKLDVLTSDWVSRDSAQGMLNHPKMREAVFSPDVLNDKHNTEAIEVAPNTLVAARVIEHQPSRVRPLAEVEPEIRTRLIHEKALQLAKAAGEAALSAARGGKEPGPRWSPFRKVSLSQALGLRAQTVEALFKAAAHGLPAYVGELDPQAGYVLYRISRIIDPPAPGPQKVLAYSQSLSRAMSLAELDAWSRYLRSRADITVHEDRLKKEAE
jgi:peptidyl-prolyl cis-trans isomerase D